VGADYIKLGSSSYLLHVKQSNCCGSKSASNKLKTSHEIVTLI